MNLMINNYCNFKCSYCFAQEEMHSKSAMNISEEDFRIYLDWLVKNNDRQVRLIGGEPTLHPQLAHFLDIVIDYDFFDNVLIFTNLSFSQEVAEMLVDKHQYVQISLLPNVNQLDLIIPTFRANVIRNLDYLSVALSTFQRISLNIFSPDQPLDMWEDIVCRYNIKSVRWSIVVPNHKLDENFDVRAYFHQFQPILLNFVEWTRKYHIDLDCDCSVVPICALDDWAVKKIMQIDPRFFNRLTCEEPVLDIAPNLDVRGCFGMNGLSTRRLDSFETMEELMDFFKDDRQKFTKKLARKECLGCERYLTIGESCTCLGYRNIDKE